MKKTFLLGLGLVAGATFYVSKKLTEEQRDKIALKLDEAILDGREATLKYDRYLHEFMHANQLELSPLKDKFLEKKDAITENEAVNDAMTSLKQATSELRARLKEASKELSEGTLDENNENLQDDIVIDGRSAFGEAKDVADFESEHPTETFYPKDTEK
ncbi:hypothetical protein LB941_02875 [Ligilactobacillus sp. WILCCON 0076]|uniref:Uncharacterized protein n=1 Tax=Ligilactobacillus ubinensis TaxID=2876789 RepID=A0A9X2FIQ8_9LACO|nr:hypothetical protein [Ligilactobacillus ubinensis]MCP0886280.1 hypothetical protein [Ligilactobacillus ubinensis]